MVNGCLLDLNLGNINKDGEMGVRFKEFHLEVKTAIPLWAVINIIRDAMGKDMHHRKRQVSNHLTVTKFDEESFLGVVDPSNLICSNVSDF